MAPAPPAPSRPVSGPPTRRCAPGSPPPSTATSTSPTRTPGSAASSPGPSATSGQHGPDQVTIKEAETPAIRPRASRRDTVHDGPPQVTAPADTKAQDNQHERGVSEDRVVTPDREQLVLPVRGLLVQVAHPADDQPRGDGLALLRSERRVRDFGDLGVRDPGAQLVVPDRARVADRGPGVLADGGDRGAD